MNRRSIFVAATFVFALGLAIATVMMRAEPQTAPAAQTAGQRFKNVQVLKDIPADQLIPAMSFISDSLGVRCGYCHVEGDFSKDAKRSKLTARKMIQMELAINQANFNGHTEVTCYTCHRGSTHPVGVPAIGVAGEAAPATMPAAEGRAGASSAAVPTADDILAKYVQAIGGSDAAGKVTSRTAKGTFTGPDDKSAPLELYAKAPGKLLLVIHSANGHLNQMAYDDGKSWGGDDQHVHPLPAGQVVVMESQAKLAFAADLRQSLGHLRVGRPEKVGEQEAYVVYATREGQPPIKLYFNQQSGLLARVETFTPTSLGMDPNVVDYSDYQESDGVKVPRRWSIGAPQIRMTIQLDQVQQNAAVDDSKFAPPAGEGAARGSQ